MYISHTYIFILLYILLGTSIDFKLVKNAKVPLINKILFIIIDIFHNLIAYLPLIVIPLFLIGKVPSNYIFIVNSIMLFSTGMYLFFHRCFLTIWSIKLLNLECSNYRFQTYHDRFLSSIQTKSNHEHDKKIEKQNFGWFAKQKYLIFSIAILNTYLWVKVKKLSFN
jgi:hypothetical protein